VMKSIAEARPEIEGKLRPALATEAVAALRKGTTIQLDDSFFDNTPAPSPARPENQTQPNAK